MIKRYILKWNWSPTVLACYEGNRKWGHQIVSRGEWVIGVKPAISANGRHTSFRGFPFSHYVLNKPDVLATKTQVRRLSSFPAQQVELLYPNNFIDIEKTDENGVTKLVGRFVNNNGKTIIKTVNEEGVLVDTPEPKSDNPYRIDFKLALRNLEVAAYQWGNAPAIVADVVGPAPVAEPGPDDGAQGDAIGPIQGPGND